LQPILRRLHGSDFRSLSVKLTAKISDHPVAMRDFGARDFMVMASIAQLFFEGRLNGCWCVWRRENSFGGVSSAAYADPVSEETEGNKQENAGRVQHPDVTPCGFTRRRDDSIGEIRRGISVSSPFRWTLWFASDAIK
jgi:hypothetical protein